MTTSWKRLDTSTNGTAKRPPATPLIQGPGASPAGDSWEKLFPAAPPRCRLDDLILAAPVQAQINTALARLLCYPIVDEAWGMSTTDPYGGGLVLNLVGAPGTGKTMAAHGIADRLGRWLIDVSYADLVSKYVGDTAKAIAGAFRAAMRSQAVLAFNDADAVISARLQQPASSADKGVNDAVIQMLRELEHFKGVVIFTTNLFGCYDQASLRRFTDYVRFEPPDLDCRKRLWQAKIPSQAPLTPDITASRLAEASDGLTGAEILKAVRTALVKAAERSGIAGPVTWEDFAFAIAREHAVKEAYRGAPRVVSETVVAPQDLPPEVKTKVDAGVPDNGPEQTG
jgi:SpoVK/Ycf46/Vps4 family AAA+-type ATPase